MQRSQESSNFVLLEIQIQRDQSKMNYRIEEIAACVHPVDVSLHQAQQQIEHVLTDSRSLTDATTTIFFALRTMTGDGHRYINVLHEHDVRSFVVARDAILDDSVLADSNVLYVRDPLEALQRLSGAWRRNFTMPVVGITGSNGKTTVKEFLYQLLSYEKKVVRSPRSFNSQLGVPLSLFKIDATDEVAIIEAGISQPGEMERLQRIIRPTYGIITNIGQAHQENFIDTVEKLDEKLRLFKDSERIVYRADDAEIEEGLRRNGLFERAVGWSTKNPEAPLFVKEMERETALTRIECILDGKAYKLQLPFTDKASLENAMHAFLLLWVLSPDLPKCAAPHLAELEPVEMRLEVKEGGEDNLIINDAYNNDINSLAIALDFMQRRALHAGKRRVLILSDILQSAFLTRNLYRMVADMVKRYECDMIIGIGRELCAYQESFKGIEGYFYTDTESFLRSSLPGKLANSVILVKGARNYRFETIVERLAQKINETVMEINLEAMAENVKSIRRHIPQGVKVMAMVKANAYGTGAYETAKMLEEHHIDALAVAVADEGKELRKKGILTPIVVMDPEVNAFSTLIDYNLDPVVFSMSQFEELYHKIDKQGFDHFPIHLEIDSGMHRLGFSPQEAFAVAERISRQSVLSVRSIFSHLAAADEPQNNDYTMSQIKVFSEAYDKMVAILGYKPIKHILNTAGIMRFPQYAFDMVRLGIGLYGVSPTPEEKLTPVVTLRTTLLQISDMPPGSTVGYGRHGLLPKGGKIGIIPIGYADGYDRRFGCGVGKVAIRGKLYPTIGNICMDTCMIDLTGSDAQPGDRVTLFGGEAPDLQELADSIGTIPYEILSHMAMRIQRIYYRG